MVALCCLGCAVWARSMRLRRNQGPRQDEETLWELCCRAAPASGLRIPLKSGDADTALGQAVMPGHSPAAGGGSSSVSVLQEEQPAGQTDPPVTGPHPGLDSPHDDAHLCLCNTGYSVLERETASP